MTKKGEYWMHISKRSKPKTQTSSSMKKYLNILAITAGASFLMGAVSAQAQLIAYDGFNYSGWDTTLAPNQQLNGGSGDYAYPWFDKAGYSQLAPAGMSYSTLPVSGVSIGQTGVNGTTQLWRVFNHNFGYYAAANGGSLWMSYMWASDNTGTLDPNGSGNYLFRQASVGFYSGGNESSSAGSEYLDIGMPNINATSADTYSPNVSLWYGGHGLDIPGAGYATAPDVQSTVAANNMNQDFILIQMLVDNNTTTADTINVWINPALGSTPAPGSEDMQYTLQDLSAIDTLRMSANGNNPNYGGYGVQQFDELRLGWTRNAVETMSTANAVPEPASMALLGLGSLGLLLFRRKKS